MRDIDDACGREVAQRRFKPAAEIAGRGLVGPEAVRNQGHARPEPHRQQLLVHQFPPQAGFAAQHLAGAGEGRWPAPSLGPLQARRDVVEAGVLELGVLKGQQCLFGCVRGVGVMHVRRIEKVKVVARGHHAVVTCSQCPVPSGGAAPALCHHSGWRSAVKRLVPADDPLAVPGGELGQALIESRLEGGGAVQALVRHVGRDFGALVPPSWVHFVAANVDEGVGKDLGEFAEQGVHCFEHRWVDGIQNRFVNAEAVTRRHRGPPRPHSGMSAQPTGCVAGQVQFGDDADAAVGRCRHQSAQLFGAVALGAGQLGIGAALETEALVVGQVQVQHVEFAQRHRVQRGEQGVQAEEAPGWIQHQTAPRKARCVLNVSKRQMAALVADLNQRGQRVPGTGQARGADAHAVVRQVQPVAFVVVQCGGASLWSSTAKRTGTVASLCPFSQPLARSSAAASGALTGPWLWSSPACARSAESRARWGRGARSNSFIAKAYSQPVAILHPRDTMGT